MAMRHLARVTLFSSPGPTFYFRRLALVSHDPAACASARGSAIGQRLCGGGSVCFGPDCRAPRGGGDSCAALVRDMAAIAAEGALAWPFACEEKTWRQFQCAADTLLAAPALDLTGPAPFRQSCLGRASCWPEVGRSPDPLYSIDPLSLGLRCASCWPEVGRICFDVTPPTLIGAAQNQFHAIPLTMPFH